MPSSSTELKAQIVKKMMPPNNQSVAQISQESGIGAATLYAWKKQFRAKGLAKVWRNQYRPHIKGTDQ